MKDTRWFPRLATNADIGRKPYTPVPDKAACPVCLISKVLNPAYDVHWIPFVDQEFWCEDCIEDAGDRNG